MSERRRSRPRHVARARAYPEHGRAWTPARPWSSSTTQPANVILLTRLLDLAGITRVHGFTDPREAVAFCAESLPDLVLLDLHMPHLDGFAVMDSLQLMVPGGRVPAGAGAHRRRHRRGQGAGARRRREGLPHQAVRPHRGAAAGRQPARDPRALPPARAAQRVAPGRARRPPRRASEVGRRPGAPPRAHRRGARARGASAWCSSPIADLTTGSVVGVEALARFGCEPLRPPERVVRRGRPPRPRRPSSSSRRSRAALDRHRRSCARDAVPGRQRVARHRGHRRARRPPRRPPRRPGRPRAHRAHPGRRLRRPARRPRPASGAGACASPSTTRAPATPGSSTCCGIHPHILKLDTALTHGIDHDPVRRSLAAALVTFALRDRARRSSRRASRRPASSTTLQRLGIPWGQGYHLARPAEIPPGLRLPALAARSASA